MCIGKVKSTSEHWKFFHFLEKKDGQPYIGSALKAGKLTKRHELCKNEIENYLIRKWRIN
jgi:hypothetical protein